MSLCTYSTILIMINILEEQHSMGLYIASTASYIVDGIAKHIYCTLTVS